MYHGAQNPTPILGTSIDPHMGHAGSSMPHLPVSGMLTPIPALSHLVRWPVPWLP